MTTLVSVDPIQVLFQLSEAQYVASMVQRMSSESAQALADSDMSGFRVLLELTNRQFYPSYCQKWTGRQKVPH